MNNKQEVYTDLEKLYQSEVLSRLERGSRLQLPLTFVEYQEEAKSTAIYDHAISVYVARLNIPEKEKEEGLKALLRKCYVILGLIGEAGELANKMKKIIRDDKGEISAEKNQEMSKELGDVLWYQSQAATEFDSKLDDTAKENLSKLASRKERGVIKGSGDER